MLYTDTEKTYPQFDNNVVCHDFANPVIFLRSVFSFTVSRPRSQPVLKTLPDWPAMDRIAPKLDVKVGWSHFILSF